MKGKRSRKREEKGKEERRRCACGCGRLLPKKARPNRKYYRRACRFRAYRKRLGEEYRRRERERARRYRQGRCQNC